MLSNCNYNKVRLLHDLSRIAWYLDRHAQEDSHSDGHGLCTEMTQEIREDLEKHIEKLRQAIEGLSKEGNFN